MSNQTIFQLILALGAILTVIGTFGSYHYGKVESRATQTKNEKLQGELQSQLSKFQGVLEAKTDLIFQSLKLKEEVWIAVQTDTVPPTSAYLALLFKSDKGRISGKVRVQGTEKASFFSTTANDTIPIAIPNLWVDSEKKYKTPIVIEFIVTEKTAPESTLQIFTQGWIDDLGQEPH